MDQRSNINEGQVDRGFPAEQTEATFCTPAARERTEKAATCKCKERFFFHVKDLRLSSLSKFLYTWAIELIDDFFLIWLVHSSAKSAEIEFLDSCTI